MKVWNAINKNGIRSIKLALSIYACISYIVCCFIFYFSFIYAFINKYKMIIIDMNHFNEFYLEFIILSILLPIALISVINFTRHIGRMENEGEN